MMWIAYILVGVSIYVLAYQFFKVGQGKEAPKLTTSAAVSQSLILRLSMPILRTTLLPSVQNLPLENFRKEKKRKIQAAGMSEELTPDEFFCFKLFLAIALPLMAVVYNFALNLVNPLILILIFGSIGYFFPELWLGSLIRDRQIKIRNAIPFVIDLLSLCTEAGLDFMGAIQRVVEKAKQSPFIDELNLVLQELKLGATRADALRNMAVRINMPEISSIVAVLVTADQMGASISQVLKAQSDQIRAERFIRAEKEGAKASQKILIPLIFCIVPAVFIVVLGPLIVRLIIQLFSGGFGGGELF
ncbi:MAG: type II secretion system F family protein [Deltaproteobacteria bacterium]|nr:type II secretion system F family protein [Deltaproteobacteria bacterium]